MYVIHFILSAIQKNAVLVKHFLSYIETIVLYYFGGFNFISSEYFVTLKVINVKKNAFCSQIV